jgi:putative tryptophan/tyrosine transport system substrate-binding protein
MRRREFITLLGGAAAWPIAVGAQQPVRVKRIGLMGNLQLRPIESFRNRLRELGYIEGQNLIVEYRFAEGREERYSGFAAELVALPVDDAVCCRA